MSAPLVIHFDYDKAEAQPVGHGYDARPALPLTGICIHTDEYAPGQTFAAVCAYGRESADVSWHYGIDTDGTVERLLDPGLWRAWHAGVSAWRGVPRCNDSMVGIECHHRAGDPWPVQQRAALTALVRQLCADHPTITPENIVCHRWIALPPGRKSDPTDWPDAAFRAWVRSL